MPSLGNEVLNEIFQKLINKKNYGRVESLSKFLLCGRKPFKLVFNHFSSVETANLKGNIIVFEIQKADGIDMYEVRMYPPNIPLLVSKSFVKSAKNILDLKTVTLPYIPSINYKDIFMTATNLQTVHFNNFQSNKLGIINFPSSCREFSFNKMEFGIAFNKSISKNIFPFVEILKINGYLDQFEKKYREAFVDFVFNSFPNLKIVDIHFKERDSHLVLNDFQKIIPKVNENIINDFTLEEISIFKFSIKFIVYILSSKNYNTVIREFTPPFSTQCRYINKTFHKSENFEIVFVFGKH